MILFDIGDIVKIKDEFLDEFCCQGEWGLPGVMPKSPYAVVLSYNNSVNYYAIGGKTIHLFPGDEKRYRLIYGPDEYKEDFCWWDANKFEKLTNQISRAWVNFCESSGWC